MSGVREGSRRRRRKRLKSSEEIDRISELPEALIVDILSLLPTKDSIRTGALARKWQHMWTRVPHLYFDDGFLPKFDHDVSSARPGDFVDFVHKTLILCSGGSKVKSLVVRWCYYEHRYKSHYDLWTRFAVDNEVEKFELESYLLLCAGGLYSLPQLLYSNSSFRELRFCFCSFVYIRGSVSWNNLKKLTIEDSELTNESFEKIVAGAPALEILNLCYIRGISHFRFGNLGLKKFSLTVDEWDLYLEDGDEFEISAPNVQSLELSGRFRTCKLVDMASLREATIFGLHHEGWDGYPILTQEVLDSLLNVQTLTLGTWVIQGIAMLPVNDRPSLSKCKCLTINTHLWKEDPSAIAILLNNTPEIETLIVTMSGHYSKHKDPLPPGHSNSYIDQYWSSQEMASNYLAHLTTVKFFGFWAYRTVAFPFVEFLLKNARRLQKVIINLETKDIFRKIAPTELFETSQKLTSFPRSSPDAKLLIHL